MEHNNQTYQKLRCTKCKKLLAIEDNLAHNLEIKCHRCRHITSFESTSHQQLILTDPDGHILSINKGVEELTGYTLKEVIGKKPSIWGKQMPISFYTEMWRDLGQKKVVTAQLTNRHKNGKLFDVSLKITPLLDKNNSIQFFLGEEQLLSC
jgi:PAS domain S-box-containing protein